MTFVPAADVAAQVQLLREVAGPNLVAVILFGSRLLGTSPDPHSATDLFVIVDDPRAFYGDLRAHGLSRRPAAVSAALNAWLAPNVIALPDPAPAGAGAKCFVISHADFVRALSPRAADHFCKGRLAQRVEFVHTRDAETERALAESLRAARIETLQWVPLELPEEFDARDFCLRMLEISYGGEIRPERGDRVLEVFAAQEAELISSFHSVLREHGGAHGIRAHGDRFVRTGRVPRRQRLHWDLYFRRSRLRATLRWSKYVFTYDDWLDYIARKLRRRTGLDLDLSPAERRWPLVLLWPKFFRVLGALRRQRHVPAPPGEPR